MLSMVGGIRKPKLVITIAGMPNLLSHRDLNEAILGEMLTGNLYEIVRSDSVDPCNHILIIVLRKIVEDDGLYFIGMRK